MRFLVMHKADANSEAERVPSPDHIENVGKLVKGAIDAGKLVDGAGLRSSARRVRVTVGAPREVRSGPYEGAHELVSDVALFKVTSMDEAIDWGARFAEAAGAREVEVGPVTEPWDLGVMPKPEGPVPLQALALVKSTADVEAGKPRDEEKLQRFLAEARTAGVLGKVHAFAPSKDGTRISGAKGTRRVVDGPFSESKELIGGFMVMEFDSRAEALEFAKQYADVVGTPEVDVRPVIPWQAR